MLAQSLARDLGPKGIHVFLAIIDGQVINEFIDDYAMRIENLTNL